MPSISLFIKSIFLTLSPMLYGLLIAYLMNPAMCFFERHLAKFFNARKKQHYKNIRMVSIIIVYICLFGTIIVSIRFLIPQILQNLKVLINNLPKYIQEMQEFTNMLEQTLDNSLATLPVPLDSSILFDSINLDKIINIQAISILIDKLISNTLNMTSAFLNLIIAFVVALYALNQKETFSNGVKRLTYAMFKTPTANKIIAIFSETNHMIIRFFVGKSLDSLIIGILCYLGLHFILKNPYALLLALIVGVFNMIPYFGPFIGAVPAIIITLFDGIAPAAGVGVFILILQQFDGLILGPKILGDSIGLTPFWTISAITLGGALWGPLGMFFASPILAVILATINRWIDKKLSSKDIILPKLELEDATPHINPPANTLKFPSFRKKP